MKPFSETGVAVRVVIFDLGGVVVDPVFGPFASKMQELSGVPRRETDTVLRKDWPRFCMGGMSEDEYWRRFSRFLGVECAPRSLRRMARSFMFMDEKVADVARRLRGRYRVAMLSNVPREWMEYVKRRYRFGQLFDAVIGSYELGLAKPYSAPGATDETRVYRAALKKLGAEPEECVFVDDHDENLAPAERLGMKTILFKNAKQLERDLRRLGIVIPPDQSTRRTANSRGAGHRL